MKTSIMTAVVLPLALVSACTSNPKPDNNETVVLAVQPAANEEIIDGSSAPATQSGVIAFPELQGTWLGPCLYFDPESPDDGYQRSTFVFNGNTFESDTVVYSDNSCATVLERGFLEFGSSLQISGVVSRPAGSASMPAGAALLIDLRFEEFMMDNKPINAAIAAVFPPETQFDIISIDNGTFYLGDKSGAMDGSTAQSRPVELDNAAGYVMQ